MKTRDIIQKTVNKGFLYIFGTNIVNKLIAFVSYAFIARLLTKQDYGTYSYAYNLLEFFILFQGLGLTSGILQFSSETSDLEKQSVFLLYGAKIGSLFNLCLVFLSFMFSFLYPFKIQGAEKIFRLLIFFLLFNYINECGMSFLRARKENKKFGILTNFSTLSLFLFTVLGAWLYSIKGYIIGRYGSIAITLLFLVITLKKDKIKFIKNFLLTKKEKKEILRYSVICMLTNAISHSLYLIDTFIIGIVCANSDILAEYKISTQIPFSLFFITLSLVTFIYPYFAQNRQNYRWLKKNTLLFFVTNAVINVFIGVFLFIFSKQVLGILYGEKYVLAHNIFRVLIISYVIGSVFRLPFGNLLGMIRYVKFNLLESIFTGIVNVVLDYFMIMKMGSIGAAWATCITMAFSGCFSFFVYIYALRIIKNNNNF